MSEIRENFEGTFLGGEKKEEVSPLERIEDNNLSSKKEELLHNIQKKPELEKIVEKNNNQEKATSQLIKEYFSIGAEKTIKKARKLGAYFLDMFHDELTKKNKSDKGSGY